MEEGQSGEVRPEGAGERLEVSIRLHGRPVEQGAILSPREVDEVAAACEDERAPLLTPRGELGAEAVPPLPWAAAAADPGWRAPALGDAETYRAERDELQRQLLLLRAQVFDYGRAFTDYAVNFRALERKLRDLCDLAGTGTPPPVPPAPVPPEAVEYARRLLGGAPTAAASALVGSYVLLLHRHPTHTEARALVEHLVAMAGQIALAFEGP